MPHTREWRDEANTHPVEVIVRFPMPDDELDRFKASLGTSKPDRPFAFIFGHGLWNDLDLQAHLNWLDTLLDATTRQQPYLAQEGALWPRLVVTPNAAGVKKPDEWLVSQGNKALSIYEESVKVEDAKRGVEHLGTFNMSVQVRSPEVLLLLGYRHADTASRPTCTTAVTAICAEIWSRR